ncbi:purine-nucleoside phosphorylase [Candidatus Peregrinibacteria bacterium]|nr:purine-nucleoside phosphorylase [Candidatus Peregrinibacteria bacterium]
MAAERFGYDDASRARDLLGERLRSDGLELDNVGQMVVLGSGLGYFPEDHMEQGATTVPFKEVYDTLGIEGEVGELEGHDRKLIMGPLKGDSEQRLVLAEAGREHPYEGVTTGRATFWLRVAQLMGEVKDLVGSNAAGILTPDTLNLEDIMLINGDIDLGSDSPLRGLNDERFGPRFPNRANYYPADVRKLVRTVAARLGMDLKEGTYVRVPGPNYESADDVRRFRAIVKGMWKDGAADGDERYVDRAPVAGVGMSTTYEEMVAEHALQSQAHPAFAHRAWLSVQTNHAAGLGAPPNTPDLDHGHVKSVAERVRVPFGRLVKEVLLGLRPGSEDYDL